MKSLSKCIIFACIETFFIMGKARFLACFPYFILVFLK